MVREKSYLVIFVPLCLCVKIFRNRQKNYILTKRERQPSKQGM